jgi:hypothetical protein
MHEDPAHLLRGTVEVRARIWGERVGCAGDSVTVLIGQRGDYRPPARQAVDYGNTLGAWPEKHILGTRLVPNENGRHWPSRHEAERAAT